MCNLLSEIKQHTYNNKAFSVNFNIKVYFTRQGTLIKGVRQMGTDFYCIVTMLKLVKKKLTNLVHYACTFVKK